jgi:hypothetical protein
VSRSVRPDYYRLISRTRRTLVLDYLEAMAAELRARQAFKDTNTPDALTVWTIAKALLDDRKMRL